MGLGRFSVTVTIADGGTRRDGSLKRGGKYLDIEQDINGLATFEDLMDFMKTSLITIAKDALKEEQSQGFDKEPTLIVDGKFHKAIERVEPFGKIQYIARESLKEIILYTYDAIERRTKKVTGEYSRHNVVTFNGTQIARTRRELESWLKGKENFDSRDVIRFINTAPYARKLESMGISRDTGGGSRRKPKYKKKDKRISSMFMNTVAVPNGTYSLAFKAVSAKYKNNSFIRYRLLSGSEFSVTRGPDLDEKTGKPFRRTFAKGKSRGRPYFYPSILITAVAAGITDSSSGA